MKKSKLLLILHYSPPIHGASKVGDTIINSKIIDSSFNVKSLKIQASDSIESIGKFSFVKIWSTIQLFFQVFHQLIMFRPKKIYFTVSPYGFAFYRDLIIISLIKLYQVFKKVDIFFHYHARGIEEFTSKSKMNKWLTNYSIRNTNIIFISKIMKKELIGLKGYKKAYFLKNGVNNNLSKENFEKILLNRNHSKKINVLYLSNMIKSKGYDTVLELIVRLKKLGKNNIEFNFAGSWASLDDENYFNNFIEEHNIKERVIYHGLVKGRKKQELFEDANMFIFPSRYPKEVFPLSLLEALSYGLPILTFNIGAISEIVNSKVGIITDKNSIVESFKKIEKEYTNKGVYLNCRKTFLNNYTTEVFENNLRDILKLENECSN